MKNLKKIIVIVFCVLLTSNLVAQIAPTSGKKTLEVKENHEGEYLQTVRRGNISDVVINAITNRVPKKLLNYGFTNITVIEVGQVPIPEGWATKLGNLTSNKTTGRAMMSNAKTYSQMVAAADKMYEPEDNDGVDWKFQVNFIDNDSKEKFKLRINMMTYNPMYLIKESDLVKDLSKD